MTPQTRADEAPHAPVRTCVGCRRKSDQHDLLRFVAYEGRVEPDPRRQRPGRGAYLHPVAECLDLALRRKAFGRALRLRGAVALSADADAMIRSMTEHQLGASG